MTAAIHRCTETECPFVGQVTSKSCLCHKTAEQMLSERVAELESACKAGLHALRMDASHRSEINDLEAALAKSGA